MKPHDKDQASTRKDADAPSQASGGFEDLDTAWFALAQEHSGDLIIPVPMEDEHVLPPPGPMRVRAALTPLPQPLPLPQTSLPPEPELPSPRELREAAARLSVPAGDEDRPHRRAGPADPDGWDDRGAAPARRSRTGLIFASSAVVTLVLCSSAYYLGHRKVAPVPGAAMTRGARSSAAYKEGRRRLLLDTEEDFLQAHDQLLRAAGADESDPQPPAALGEMHALWSRALEAEAQGAGPLVAEKLTGEARRHAQSARRYAEQALALSSSSREANRAMAVAMIVGGSPEAEVRPYLSRAASPAPQDPEVLYASALLSLREKRVEEARATLESTLVQQPVLLRAAMLLGQIEAQAGNPEVARKYFGQVLAQNPRHPQAVQAVEELDRALARQASTRDLSAGAVSAGPEVAQPAPPPPTSTETARAEPAGTEARKAEVKRTGPARAVRPAAAAKAQRAPGPAAAGRPGKAAQEEEAPELPQDFPDQLELAERLLSHNRARDAQRLYQQMLAQHSDDPAVHAGLGSCALKTEHYLEAVEQFVEALSSKSDYPPAMFGLAEAYKKRGDRARALEWYRSYLEKSPYGPEASRARSNIARLDPSAPAQEGPPGPTGAQAEAPKPQ